LSSRRNLYRSSKYLAQTSGPYIHSVTPTKDLQILLHTKIQLITTEAEETERRKRKAYQQKQVLKKQLF